MALVVVSDSGAYGLFQMHPGHPLGAEAAVSEFFAVAGDGTSLLCGSERAAREIAAGEHDDTIAKLRSTVERNARPDPAV